MIKDHLGNEFSSLKKLCEFHKIRYQQVLNKRKTKNLQDIIKEELGRNTVNHKHEPELDSENPFYKYVYRKSDVSRETLILIYRELMKSYPLGKLNECYSEAIQYLDCLKI